MSLRKTMEALLHRVADCLYDWRERWYRYRSGTRAAAVNPPPVAKLPPIEWKKVGVVTGVRTLINRRPLIAIACSLALAGLCVLVPLNMGSTRFGGASAFYYDAGTGKTFVAAAGLLTPIAAPSGAKLADGETAGVKAYVFACGGCEDASRHFVGYVERLAPAHRAALLAGTAPAKAMEGFSDFEAYIESGWLIAGPEKDAEWFPKDSSEAESIMDEAFDRCKGEPAFPCQPQ